MCNIARTVHDANFSLANQPYTQWNENTAQNVSKSIACKVGLIECSKEVFYRIITRI